MQAAGDRQRRLLGPIVSDPPPRAELVAGLARAAGWVLPAQVAVVVLGERQQDGLLLPPGVLADWTGPSRACSCRTRTARDGRRRSTGP